jgi:hypothetical protein
VLAVIQIDRSLVRHFQILIPLLISTATCFGQDINPYTKEPFYDKYQLENKIVKRNRIKYIVDSSEFISPSKFNLKVYDTLGRLIGDINRSFDGFDNPFVYTGNGDTTYRLKYNKDRTQLLCFERFVLNKKRQTISYLDCCNYYFKEDSYYVGYEEFFYDEKDRLKTRLTYFKEDYPGKISDKAKIKPADLQLNDVVYYTYQTIKNGNKLVIGNHALGKAEWREVDSTIYDKQNRIVRSNTFSKMGSMGEMVQNNVNRVTEYSYTDTTLRMTSYTTYCIASLSNFDCFEYSQPDKEVTLIFYNKDKTKKAVYSFYKSGERYLRNKYEYHYY